MYCWNERRMGISTSERNVSGTLIADGTKEDGVARPELIETVCRIMEPVFLKRCSSNRSGPIGIKSVALPRGFNTVVPSGTTRC